MAWGSGAIEEGPNLGGYGGETLSSIWDWMKNQKIMEDLRRAAQPVYSAETASETPMPTRDPLTRPAPAAGRSGSISPETRSGMWQRGKELEKEEERAAREKTAAKYRFAGEAVKTAAGFMDQPTPVAERGPVSQASGNFGTVNPLPQSNAQIQARILSQPSIISALFGGYVPSGR